MMLWIGVPAVILITRLSYKLGVRKPFLWVPSIILAFTAWAIIPVNLTMSWLLMVLMGIATTTRFTTILTLPVEMMPQEQSGAASGLVMSVGYIGAIIGPLIGGHILDTSGSFLIIFLMLIAVSIASFVISLAISETGVGHR